jgi:mono/diheme cytochrome c family protein
MNKHRLVVMMGLAVVGVVAMLATVIRDPNAEAKNGDAKRGEYLVKAGGCGDCHTPMQMVHDEGEPDSTRTFSGHPANMAMPTAPQLTMPWAGAFAFTMTAWSGPWGVSYSANITPDRSTGLGDWSEDNFVNSIRTGRHMGSGRPILPPMPIPPLQNLNDVDVRAMFAYLRTVPPIQNRVPAPLPPQVKRIEP